jgi:hypothetical protein
MIQTYFFIFSIITVSSIISGVGVVYAEDISNHFVANSTVTAFLNPPVITTVTVFISPECVDLRGFRNDGRKCITPPDDGGGGGGGGSSGGGGGGSSGGGGCRPTGVGPDGTHGHGGSSGAIGRDCGRTGVGPGVSGDTRIHIAPHKPNISSDYIPLWISNVVIWWIDDKITQDEFQNTITYLLDQNIIPNNTPKLDTALVKFDPTTKRIFELWVNGNLQDNYILKIIQDYRQLGVW